MNPSLYYDRFDSPVGPLVLAIDGAGLRHVVFEHARHAPDMSGWRHDPAVLAPFRDQFLAFLHGRRRDFDLPLAPQGTPFQHEVWRALRQVPFGATTSYAQLAARIGRPAAVRAVGAANGRNPLAIVVPCHRVIGRDGRLTGFAGGLAAKATLLALEGHALQHAAAAATAATHCR